MLKEYRYGDVVVHVREEFGIAHAAVTGEIDGGVARRLIADSSDWCAGRPALAQSVDYSGARVLLSADRLMAGLMAGLGGRAPVPTVIVSSLDQFRMFDSYSRMARDRDIPKDVFTTAEAAHRWAIQQGMARAARLEARYRREAQRRHASTEAPPDPLLPASSSAGCRTSPPDSGRSG